MYVPFKPSVSNITHCTPLRCGGRQVRGYHRRQGCSALQRVRRRLRAPRRSHARERGPPRRGKEVELKKVFRPRKIELSTLLQQRNRFSFNSRQYNSREHKLLYSSSSSCIDASDRENDVVPVRALRALARYRGKAVQVDISLTPC